MVRASDYESVEQVDLFARQVCAAAPQPNEIRPASACGARAKHLRCFGGAETNLRRKLKVSVSEAEGEKAGKEQSS